MFKLPVISEVDDSLKLFVVDVSEKDELEIDESGITPHPTKNIIIETSWILIFKKYLL